MTLSCIDDQSVNCTFTTYENIRLLTLFERDPRGRKLLWSSVHIRPEYDCFIVYR